MLTFAYSQNDDPRWKAYRETRSGVCMALSTHYVICALTGADFVKWLDAPSGRERPGGRAPRVVIGAQRSGPVKNVRAIYDQHETFKRMIGGYRDMELRWLRNYIQGHARATTGQLSLGNGTAAIGPTQVPVELVKALKSGAAVYFAWTSSAAGARFLSRTMACIAIRVSPSSSGSGSIWPTCSPATASTRSTVSTGSLSAETERKAQALRTSGSTVY